MGLKLTIDRGNSASKAVVWDNDTIVACESYPTVTVDEITALRRRFPFDAAVFCSVADSGDIVGALKAIGMEPLEFNGMTPSPLTVDYSTPETLGADRLAAAVGAWTLFPGHDILIADIGTAATYDTVSALRHYRGGNIAPGVGMRLRALNAFTARLPLVKSTGETPLWGHSTETAIRAGAVNGVIAEIEFYRRRAGNDTRVVITGGWGEEIARRLDFEATYDRNLVNRGLNCILRYNETK